MSQVERIKALLRNGPVCSFADLYAAGMPNGRNRIGELRRERGWVIESRRCERDHPAGTEPHTEYVADPDYCEPAPWEGVDTRVEGGGSGENVDVYAVAGWF